MRALALAWFAVLAPACGEPARRASEPDRSAEASAPAASGGPASAASTSASSATAEPGRAPLAGPGLIALEVPGFKSAVVAVPIGAREKRRVFLATHGNYDRPEWQCQVWNEILGGRHFVLCPRGVGRPDSPSPDDTRFTYKSNQELEREVDAALGALRKSAFASYLAEAPPVWTGFSLGAIMGVAIASRRPADFPELVLIEGGVDRFGEDQARAFAKGGGKRVLFACAQAGCAKSAQKRADRMEKLGIRTAVVYAGPVGHTYDGAVADAVAKALPSFLGDEGRADDKTK